jgi:eukaryotic-like serine/threonine-protein kinase
LTSPETRPGERRRRYVFAGFTLDAERRVLLRGDQEVTLRSKSFEVLAYLVCHHGQLVTKTELMEAAWSNTAVTDNSLAQCMVEIRRVLDDDSQQLIRTVARRGYLFTGQVITPVVEIPRQPVAAPMQRAHRMALRPAPVLNGVLVIATLVLGAIAAYVVVRPDRRANPVINVSFTQLTDQAGRETFPSLAADGRTFVYAGRDTGNWDIYLQRVGGKNPIHLTKDCPNDDNQPALSPDGEEIAFRSERDGGGIFVMGATGESVRRLTNFGFNPAWSPDGKEIVVGTASAWGPHSRIAVYSQLWVVNASNGEKRMLTNPASVPDAVQPNWSPHGRRVAYWAVRDGQRDIWTVSANGAQPVAVTQDAALDWSPVWSPDGNRLYFASDRSGSMNLWRVRIDEKSGRVLGQAEPVTTPSPYSGPFSISGDGRRIAYAQALETANIQTAGFDPVKETIVSQPRWITQGSRQAGYPDLSPDGVWLAYNDGGIFVVKSDGTELRQLTDGVYKDRYPRWSPDGQRIAFHSNHGGEYDIWLIHRDGSGLQRLTWTSAPILYFPVWSPDGNRLVYTTQQNAFVMELTRPWKEQSLKPVPVPAEFGAKFYPWSWSPDGRKLAGALIKPDGVSVVGLGIYSLESQQLERLPEIGYNPVWLGDSRRLLAQDHRGRLYVIDSQFKTSREILNVAPHALNGTTISRNNRQLYLSVRVSEADIWLATLETQ